MTSTVQIDEVVAADTAITYIDGHKGELRYRGYDVGDLALHSSFEAVAYLLWHGELPPLGQLQALHGELGEARTRADSMLAALEAIPLTAHPLDVLRYFVSLDALTNPAVADNHPEANLRKAIAFTAWFPVVVAGFHRLRQGAEPVRPDPTMGTAEAFLTMLHGREPSAVATRTLETSMILHEEHELNASTFAARVTIATQSNLHAAVASALGTLLGPRHGGASERIITMLETVGSPERAEEYVRSELAAKRRIMGFGHRVYRTVDPRSRHLRAMAERLTAGTPHAVWIEILDRLGEILAAEKRLYPNVDLYAAVVNHQLGIDPAFYTAIFACSRIPGWTAHAIEQLDGRMIRPAAAYHGPAPREWPEAEGDLA